MATMKKNSLYKVIFMNQGQVYEVYAKEVGQSAMLGFVEVEGLTFGEKSSVVIDPSEEKLKGEFQEVKRTYIPMHAIIRIDEVEKQGVAKIIPVDGKSDQVVGFPGSYMPSANTPKDDK